MSSKGKSTRQKCPCLRSEVPIRHTRNERPVRSMLHLSATSFRLWKVWFRFWESGWKYAHQWSMAPTSSAPTVRRHRMLHGEIPTHFSRLNLAVQNHPEAPEESQRISKGAKLRIDDCYFVAKINANDIYRLSMIPVLTMINYFPQFTILTMFPCFCPCSPHVSPVFHHSSPVFNI